MSLTRTTLPVCLACLLACPGPSSDLDTATDTDASSSSSSSSSTTAMNSSSSTGSTGGGFPECSPPDPALLVSYSFDLSAWDPAYDPQTGMIDVSAKCTVTASTPAGTSLTLELSCTQGMVQVPISATFQLPAELPVALAQDDVVSLRYLANGPVHHSPAGSKFAIHADTPAARLLFAGYDNEMKGVIAWNEIITPLAVDLVSGLCPCAGICEFNDEGSERQGLRVSDQGDNAATVLDGQRGTLTLPGESFEIVVDSAVMEYCLNCFGNYRLLIAAG